MVENNVRVELNENLKGKTLSIVNLKGDEIECFLVDSFYFKSDEAINDFESNDENVKRVYGIDFKYDLLSRDLAGNYLFIEGENIYYLNHEEGELLETLMTLSTLSEFVQDEVRQDVDQINETLINLDEVSFDVLKEKIDLSILNEKDNNEKPYIEYLVTKGEFEFWNSLKNEGVQLKNIIGNCGHLLDLDRIKMFVSLGIDPTLKNEYTKMDLLQVAISAEKRDNVIYLLENFNWEIDENDFNWMLIRGQITEKFRNEMENWFSSSGVSAVL